MDYMERAMAGITFTRLANYLPAWGQREYVPGSGLELVAATRFPVTLDPGQVYGVPTGLRVEIDGPSVLHIRASETLEQCGVVVLSPVVTRWDRNELIVKLYALHSPVLIVPGSVIASALALVLDEGSFTRMGE